MYKKRCHVTGDDDVRVTSRQVVAIASEVQRSQLQRNNVADRPTISHSRLSARPRGPSRTGDRGS